MIILGVVLLALGWIMGIGILLTLGLILVAIGAVLYVWGAVGRPIDG